MPDRSHMHAQLMRPPGIGLQLDPSTGVASPFDNSIACAGRLTVLLVDMHLLATATGLLADWQIDEPIYDVRHTHDKRPVYFARRAR